MKYVYCIISITLAVVLSFCSGEKQTIVEKTSVSNISKQLSDNAIFIKDSVIAGNQFATRLQKDEGRKFF